jgi:hypothetical protein
MPAWHHRDRGDTGAGSREIGALPNLDRLHLATMQVLELTAC